MCYLCKYKTYQCGRYRSNPTVKEFIQYVHNNRVPITELFQARDEWIEKECSTIKAGSRSYKKCAITELIEHVSRREKVENVDTVPVYHMNRYGEYTLINGGDTMRG